MIYRKNGVMALQDTAQGPVGVDYHFYEPGNGHGLAHDPLKAIVAPRPIGWISSRSANGVNNLAPYSFFNLISDNPPLLAFCSSGPKDSLVNVLETGEFGWNLATRTLAEQMNLSSASVPIDVDEFALAGLTPKPALLISAPLVAETPVSMECRVTQIVDLVDIDGAPHRSRLVIGQIVGVHIRRDTIIEDIYCTERARPIMRAGGRGDYFEALASGKFHMPRPTVPL
jgi:flavin reductase (DIM6/NTAB) family NADH-FMN oxidoreductase RutF